MAKETILNRSWKRFKKNLNLLLHYWTSGPDKTDEAAPTPPSFKPLPFHPVLEEEVGKLNTPEALLARVPQSADDIVSPAGDILHEERTIPGPDGNTITLSIFRRRPDPPEHPASAPPPRPCILDLHAGGLVAGTRFATVSGLGLSAVRRLNAVCVSPEYRLAPAHRHPGPVADCFAALRWVAGAAAELGVDPARLVVGGASAGGGLAAACALLARDGKGPRLCGQLLMCPMLDDRSDSVSAWQMAGRGVWDRAMNVEAWDALLGPERHNTGDISMYASPSRCEDLSGLPPAFIDVGSCDMFRDENVQYAAKLWRDGTQCELHVWPGGFHNFDIFCPSVDISVAAREAEINWLQRLLSSVDE